MLWHLEQEIKINIQHTNHKTGVFSSIPLVPEKCHISSPDMFLCFYKLLQSWKFLQFLENFSLSDALQFFLLQKIEFKSVEKNWKLLDSFLLPSCGLLEDTWKRTSKWYIDFCRRNPLPQGHGCTRVWHFWVIPMGKSHCLEPLELLLAVEGGRAGLCQASPRTHCWQGQLWLQLEWQLLSLCLGVQRGMRLRLSSQLLIHTQGSTQS